MSGICGPHRLQTSTPERIRFHHSANVFKSMATTLGTLSYGTDVTIDIEDAEHFSSYSLSLPLVGAVMITTYFTDAFTMTLVFGVPFLLILTVVYWIFFRKPGAAVALNPLPKV